MNDTVHAGKDETYRQGLSVEGQAMLPANPAGEIDLTDEELEAVYGAWGSFFEDDGVAVANKNTNTATSTSSANATGGSASVSIPLLSI